MKTNLLGILLLSGSVSVHAASTSNDASVFDYGNSAKLGVSLTSGTAAQSRTVYEMNSFDVNGLNVGIQLAENHGAYSTFERKLHWDVKHSQRNTDVLGDSNGDEFSATLSRSYAFNKLNVTPAFGINWQDSDLVDFYHGVNASQSIRNRDVFSGVNTNASITASFQITKSLVGIGAVRSDFFGDSIANSPVVDGNTVTEATVGVVYSF